MRVQSVVNKKTSKRVKKGLFVINSNDMNYTKKNNKLKYIFISLNKSISCASVHVYKFLKEKVAYTQT